MRLGSLFAGIGGFELAATWAGITPVWSNEIEPFACKVLNKNFSHEIIQKDIREIGKHNLPAVDIISGGFPCQPFSQAGKRKGTEDNRYLWPEMLRIIRELQPSWVIGENVAGLLSMERGETLKRILADLEAEGYNNEVFIIPACGKGAWHRRDRIWIISDTRHPEPQGWNQPQTNNKGCSRERIPKGGEPTSSCDATNTNNPRERTPGGRANENGQEIKQGRNEPQPESGRYSEDATNTKRIRGSAGMAGQEQGQKGNSGVFINGDNKTGGRQGASKGPTEPGMGRVADGLPSELDGYWNQEPEGVPRVSTGIANRADRLKGLGNAIVPQVAYELFKAIHENVQG